MLGSQRRWIEPLEDRIAVRQLRASQRWSRDLIFVAFEINENTGKANI